MYNVFNRKSHTVNSNRFCIVLENEFEVKFELVTVNNNGDVYNCMSATAIIEDFEFMFFDDAIENATKRDFFEYLLEADSEITSFLEYDDDACYDYNL